MIYILMIWATVTPFLLLRILFATLTFLKVVQMWREQEEEQSLIVAVAMMAAALSPLIAGRDVFGVMQAVACVMAISVAWWLFEAMASWRKEKLVTHSQGLGDVPVLQGQKWGRFEVFNTQWIDGTQCGSLAPWARWNNVRTRTAAGIFIIIAVNLTAWFVTQ